MLPAKERFNSRNQLFHKSKASLPQEVFLNWSDYDEKSLPIYILTAIGSNTTDIGEYDKEVKLNGWLDTKREKKGIKCCFMWMDETISEFYGPTFFLDGKLSILKAVNISCPYDRLNTSLEVIGVTLQFSKIQCPTDGKMYVKVTFPKRTDSNESFAICLKIVYGRTIDANLFIDWIEFQRQMKVDKIFMFTYNISWKIDNIIKHYVQLGLVESRPFNYPRKFESEYIPLHDLQVLSLCCCSSQKYLMVEHSILSRFMFSLFKLT